MMWFYSVVHGEFKLMDPGIKRVAHFYYYLSYVTISLKKIDQ